MGLGIGSQATPLCLATGLEQEDMVQLLLENGATQAVPIHYQAAPLNQAIRLGFHSIAKRLVANHPCKQRHSVHLTTMQPLFLQP